MQHIRATRTDLAIFCQCAVLVTGFSVLARAGENVPKDKATVNHAAVTVKTAKLILVSVDIESGLRDALKRGTPAEKERALDIIRKLKPISLIPDIIEAIEDPTPLPEERSGDCVTGWSFVGHYAATVMGEIAFQFDGLRMGQQPGERPRRPYSFYDDLGAGPQMKASGRLAEVRKNWQQWWETDRKAPLKRVAPVLKP